MQLGLFTYRRRCATHNLIYDYARMKSSIKKSQSSFDAKRVNGRNFNEVDVEKNKYTH